MEIDCCTHRRTTKKLMACGTTYQEQNFEKSLLLHNFFKLCAERNIEKHICIRTFVNTKSNRR